jgi:hypothetical protein
MTITLNLPPDVERALLTEASARGLSPDEFLSQMVISRTDASQDSVLTAVLVPEDGVPVLRTGQPLAASVVDEVLEAVRLEREHHLLGLAH